ncbi:hypothetical protein HPP92_011968 [Vanilla planifolia]|uniref:Uncharacterized protein n=1 Tax=Vanilla planifolia TaxID=51239 RepID=A0A835R3Z1_VANPL|nr:hypothetical protein HPP92_011968 [Vanilla planifolia]
MDATPPARLRDTKDTTSCGSSGFSHSKVIGASNWSTSPRTSSWTLTITFVLFCDKTLLIQGANLKQDHPSLRRKRKRKDCSTLWYMLFPLLSPICTLYAALFFFNNCYEIVIINNIIK